MFPLMRCSEKTVSDRVRDNVWKAVKSFAMWCRVAATNTRKRNFSCSWTCRELIYKRWPSSLVPPPVGRDFVVRKTLQRPHALAAFYPLAHNISKEHCNWRLRTTPFHFLRSAPSIVHHSRTLSAGWERIWSALQTWWLHVFKLHFLDTPNNRYLRSKVAKAAGWAAEAKSNL